MDTGSDALKPVSYKAVMKMDRAAEREYMFDHVCKQEKKRFYEVNMHGVDWEMMSASYRKFLPHINNNYDFAELLSELLGELNVSHTGGRFIRLYRARLPETWESCMIGIMKETEYVWLKL